MKIRTRVKWVAMLVAVFGVVVCSGATVEVQNNSDEGEKSRSISKSLRKSFTQVPNTDEVALENWRMVSNENPVSTTIAPIVENEGRFFLKVSDVTSLMLQQNIESVPPSLRGPLLFFMGFSQQSMENFMTNMRSFGRMIVTSLVTVSYTHLTLPTIYSV